MTVPRVVPEYQPRWTSSAGFFAASSNGGYRDAGLDVGLTAAEPSRGGPSAYLARGGATLAVSPADRRPASRERGKRLAAIAAAARRATQTLQATTPTRITRPRDVQRRRGTPRPTPRGLAVACHLVAVDGGDPDRVVAVGSGPGEPHTEDLIHSASSEHGVLRSPGGSAGAFLPVGSPV